MNNSHENTTLSFERILFFSDAVFAIVITLLVLELRVPHIDEEHLSNAAIRHELWELLPKFFGFIYSFFIVGLMWIEHHRIFRYISSYDFGLIWRNLVFLLFVAFIPFPTALFSEYIRYQTPFVLYALSFGFAALAKIWIWRYVVGKRSELMVDEIDDDTVARITWRSWAIPIVCTMAIGMSFVAVGLGGMTFPLIPLVAHLLYRDKKSAKEHSSAE